MNTIKAAKGLKPSPLSTLLCGLLLSMSISASGEVHLVTYLGSDGSTSFTAPKAKIFNAERIARQALDRLDLNLKVSQLPAMRALQQADAGYVDGDLWRLVGTDQHYANLVAVPEPLCYAKIYFYTLLDRTQSNFWSVMENPRVILLPETQALAAQLPQSLIARAPVQTLSISQALRALLRGDGNMILLPEGLIEVIEQEQKGALPWVLKLHPQVSQLPAHMLVHRRHWGITDTLAGHISDSKSTFNQTEHLPLATPIACR